MTMPFSKLVTKDFHKEVYVNFVDYFVIASDQKFLIRRIKDESVTEMMIPVQNTLHCSGSTMWITWISSRLPPPS